MATAYVARKLNIPAIIIVPSSSPELVVQKLRDQGATVRVVGKVRVPVLDEDFIKLYLIYSSSLFSPLL